MRALLEVQDAAFARGDRVIFENLSFEVPAGSICCLLGPNGCGKTTLLRCIAGTLGLLRGRVLINGADAALLTVRARARSIAVVLQDQPAAFAYKVMDVVAMGRAPHIGFFGAPGSRDLQIARAALERIGIADLTDRRFTELSGGERQLVMIARALAQESQIVVLDEPTAHLDYGNQALVLRTLRALARDGVSLVMTTHYPNDALAVADSVALLADGSFVGVGTPESVITESAISRVYGVRTAVVVSERQFAQRHYVVPLID